MQNTREKFLLVLLVMPLVVSSGSVWAKDGWYMGMDLGIAMAPEMDVNGRDNDLGSTCDLFYNPKGYGVDQRDHKCVHTDKSKGDSWTNVIDGGAGVLAGLALGYRLGDFRMEGEYFYRTATHDDKSDKTIYDDTPSGIAEQDAELEEAIAGVDDVLSHNFFANLYYDFRSDSKFTPYLGLGVGVARVSLDYFSRWKRSDDPDDIKAYIAYVPADEKRRHQERLAGATTVGRAKLSDTLFGYQVLAGVDYQVSAPVTIGLKFRWADFGEFQDREEWDQLRSHDSTLGRGTRVRYHVMTDDIQFWGVSLNMKYQF